MPILVMGIVAVIALVIIFGLCIGAGLEEPKDTGEHPEDHPGKRAA